ncbi:MAG: hypothetical protein KGL99_02680 [Burkholderiales bacterium]|nr:hypothetical protein [Burkholderiales bacterium]MDE2297283.1 hypothetical protein [Burkholderiales bacterium]MDE2626034.1 hypothetical protein [Burkholderiales bacterium]
MKHPLLRLIATRPQLLADHAEAYAALIGDEVGATAAVWKRRALFGATALCLGGVAAVLGGVAFMLWAVMPAAGLHAPWALIAAPALPALIALGCGLEARRAQGAAFAELRRQVGIDFSMLRQASAP